MLMNMSWMSVLTWTVLLQTVQILFIAENPRSTLAVANGRTRMISIRCRKFGNWSLHAGFCRKVDHALCCCWAVIRVTAPLTAGHSFRQATTGSQSLSARSSAKWSRSNCTSLSPNFARSSCVFDHSRGSDSGEQAASMGSSWTLLNRVFILPTTISMSWIFVPWNFCRVASEKLFSCIVLNVPSELLFR